MDRKRNNEHAEITWVDRLRVPFYALKQWRITLRLLKPLLRHPLTALRNVPSLFVRVDDGPACVGLGVRGRKEFLDQVRGQLERWRRGELPARPSLWIMQAYCQKPMKCVCGPEPDSPYYQPDVQRRFNEFCRLDSPAATPVCGSDTCTIGHTARLLSGAVMELDVQLKIMLDERQMADFWAEMLDFQARTGQPLLFVMEVCPYALWLARYTMFQLKSPRGIVFFLGPGERCRNFCQYREADAGHKQPETYTRLEASAKNLRDEFIRQILELSRK